MSEIVLLAGEVETGFVVGVLDVDSGKAVQVVGIVEAVLVGGKVEVGDGRFYNRCTASSWYCRGRCW